jgi:di/tricarboxylate transporter
MVITLAVLTVTVVFFVMGKYRSDLIAVCALICLMLFGILTPEEALSGFSNSIVLILAGVFIIGGAVVRTGLAGAISNKILGLAGDNQNLIFMLIMFLTAMIGSLVSTTGTVAIMMPIVVSMAAALNASPSRFLMPLAFMSSMGGMLTLIGNSPNMVVNDVYVKAGFESLTLFSFLPVGLVTLAFGMFILAPATSWFLARRKNEKGESKDKGMSLKDLAEKYQLTQNMFKAEVQEGSSLAGRTLAELGLTGKYEVVIQEIRRGKNQEQIAPGPGTVILTGDTLHCMGAPEKVEHMAEACGLKLGGSLGEIKDKDKYRFESIGICELVLMSASRFVNRTVAESGLREQFGISVLSIQRGDQYIRDNLKDRVIQPGDALLVQGSWENIARLADFSQNWVIVGRPEEHIKSSALKHKMPYVASIIMLMILAMAAGLLPTVTAIMLAAALIIVGGCFRNLEEAYLAINWETIVMIASMLPFAIAMEKTGMVAIAAQFMTALGTAYGPYMALAVVYFVTSGMNIIISSTPVALLVAPVAIQIALNLGYSPLPFVFGVATAACMCFASPFSTPSNALVMSAGRYTFFDYLKIGLPLQILMGIVMVIALPLLFPF